MCFGVVYGVFVLGGLGFFRGAGGGQDFGYFSGVACRVAKSECFSHVHMGSCSLMCSLSGGLGFACVAFAFLDGRWGGPLSLRLVLCKSV